MSIEPQEQNSEALQPEILEPQQETPAEPASEEAKPDIDSLLSRLNGLAAPEEPELADRPKFVPTPDQPFLPMAPRNFQELGSSEGQIAELISKYLLGIGNASIRQITDQICVPFHMVEKVVAEMKNEQLLGYVDQAAMNDYICRLTDEGRQRAKRYSDQCSYFGACPVPYKDYIGSVTAQTINAQNPSEEDLKRAFSDLLIDPEMLIKLGPAVNSGKGMFLFGFPGNGKTSIAERVTASFGKYIYVPRALAMDKDVVRLFDPMNHVEAPAEETDGILSDDHVDKRWVRIERPTIVVGGELTMEHLEIQYNPTTGISESPVQMKSNCGTLVIDDFGRQRMSVDELLNRWIVPLEKRYDYLNTSNGKKVQVPFDQLVIFSTNLEPKDLVDDAFLRRIPYKIEVPNPSLKNFVKLFEIMCKIYKFEWRPEMIKRLIEKHYLPTKRPFRNCHPRDLLLQVKNYCLYLKKPIELSDEALDFACENYFSVM